MKKYLGILAGMVAGTLALVANPALARTNVDIHIGIPGVVYAQPAPVYVQPQPVYVQPQPVYVQPRPVYVQPQPVYVQPRPVYVQPQPVYVQPRPVHVGRHHRNGWRDQDRDGVANRYDRDRDGDGVPNRWDSRPRNPYRY